MPYSRHQDKRHGRTPALWTPVGLAGSTRCGHFPVVQMLTLLGHARVHSFLTQFVRPNNHNASSQESRQPVSKVVPRVSIRVSIAKMSAH